MVSEAIRTWAAEWADAFDQSWTAEKLEELGGKRIKGEKAATADEGPKGFVGLVVGYSVDTLNFIPEEGAEAEVVRRFSLILDNGTQVALLSEMTVEEVDEE